MNKNQIIDNYWLKLLPLAIVLVVVFAGVFHNHQADQLANQSRNLSDTIVMGDITLKEALILLLLGLLSGVVGGLLGMGGGVMKVANLHLILGFEILLARIVSLISYFVISIAAFLMYRKFNLVLWKVTKMLIPSAILGAIIGVIIGN